MADTTPNHLYGGIPFYSQVEGTSETIYQETGQPAFTPMPGFEQVEGDTAAEEYLVDQMQRHAQETAGTDHNAVLRVATLLNVVHKNRHQALHRRKDDTGPDFETYTYVLPLTGGYLYWQHTNVVSDNE
jgi:hypothetical protein